MNAPEISKQQLETLCKKHFVEKLYLFGSALGTDFNAESDIDFLVKFYGVELTSYFKNYLSLKENLEEITGRQIDLVEEQTVRNPILKRTINRSKKLIFDSKLVA